MHIYIYIYVKPSSSSNFSIRVVRAHPLIKIRQTVPCRAIRGSSILVDSTLYSISVDSTLSKIPYIIYLYNLYIYIYV